ncbi:unnamed protein product [Periconia digitata]|uniref:Uncharacterized protein n=1 Tax=Periconia digitata TaxID=1303443 RepID=A0A9W4U3M1_9PLEO|nr:unnamed protein product [Periconia digitata]
MNRLQSEFDNTIKPCVLAARFDGDKVFFVLHPFPFIFHQRFSVMQIHAQVLTICFSRLREREHLLTRIEEVCVCAKGCFSTSQID